MRLTAKQVESLALLLREHKERQTRVRSGMHDCGYPKPRKLINAQVAALEKVLAKPG
jgi:hypothetical protein